MHPGLVRAALCPWGTAGDQNQSQLPARASSGISSWGCTLPYPSTGSMYIILYTWDKHTHDLWQRRLAGAQSWVRPPAALPRMALPARPVAERQYIPKPHAHGEASQAAGHQLVLRPPAITHFSTTAQQPQPLLHAPGSRLGFQIHVSCSISKTKYQSPLTLLAFKTSFDICMWGCIFPGGFTEKLW